MTEFLELVKEAPNFNAMERDELVMYAYAMFAAGAKADSENVKLRELLAKAGELIVIAGWPDVECDEMASTVMYDIRELGVEP